MPGGRPKAWDINDRFLDLVKKLASQNKTDNQIAETLGISRSTLYKYKSESGEFSDAIAEGKICVDDMVESAMLSRACGYSHEEVRLAMYEGQFTDERVIMKHYPPDVNAGFMWLRNRRPDKWKDSPGEEDAEIPMPRGDKSLQSCEAASCDKDISVEIRHNDAIHYFCPECAGKFNYTLAIAQ